MQIEATAEGKGRPARSAPRPPSSPPVPGGSADAPPFTLPGEHFAAAMAFWVTGALGLVWVAPDLVRGAYPLPRVVAVTHLFTLGWITTSIMGALYQFVPVALGRPIRSIGLAHVTFALYVPGLLAFVAGLATSARALTLGGAAVFGTGVVLFIGNLSATLASAERRDVTWWALAAATFFLFVTFLLGLALTGNLHSGFLGASRFTALGVHLHVALAGWVLLVMIGVGHRLLPMFLLSHGAGDLGSRVAVGLVASGAGVLAFLHHAPPLLGRWLPAALIGAGLAAFLLQARAFFRHRRRPDLDPGLRLAAGGLAVLAIGLLMAAPVIAGTASARFATAYVLFLVLGIGLFVAGHYYKIVPFLVWFHRFGPLVGRSKVPTVSELYSARVASVAGGLMLLGVSALGASVILDAATPARIAALALLAGAAIEATQMTALARRRPTP